MIRIFVWNKVMMYIGVCKVNILGIIFVRFASEELFGRFVLYGIIVKSREVLRNYLVSEM